MLETSNDLSQTIAIFEDLCVLYCLFRLVYSLVALVPFLTGIKCYKDELKNQEVAVFLTLILK